MDRPRGWFKSLRTAEFFSLITGMVCFFDCSSDSTLWTLLDSITYLVLSRTVHNDISVLVKSRYKQASPHKYPTRKGKALVAIPDHEILHKILKTPKSDFRGCVDNALRNGDLDHAQEMHAKERHIILVPGHSASNVGECINGWSITGH